LQNSVRAGAIAAAAITLMLCSTFVDAGAITAWPSSILTCADLVSARSLQITSLSCFSKSVSLEKICTNDDYVPNIGKELCKR